MDRNEFSRRALLLLTVALVSDRAAARGGGRGGGRSRGGGRGSGSGGMGVLLFIAAVWGAIWGFSKLFGRKPGPIGSKSVSLTPRPSAGTPPLEPTSIAVNRPSREKWGELGLCPLCGSTMRIRTAKKGRYSGSTFKGCSTYPRCRGIRET
ncbi:topoisomerase DNA-binding C4 zinc finger domain-containing protein [Pseudomonas putida]|uniref:topoisomerase DNA-binding C4 zinc finger domain-containing protein n=1 Tax=Pseudomonas TaxID=286 RepID=UPI000FFB3653